jgi:hypothetical protein
MGWVIRRRKWREIRGRWRRIRDKFVRRSAEWECFGIFNETQ